MVLRLPAKEPGMPSARVNRPRRSEAQGPKIHPGPTAKARSHHSVPGPTAPLRPPLHPSSRDRHGDETACQSNIIVDKLPLLRYLRL